MDRHQKAAKAAYLGQHLNEIGATDFAAAGMLGNSDAESNFRSDAYNPRLENSHGLFQLNQRAGRWAPYLAWAAKNNRQPLRSARPTRLCQGRVKPYASKGPGRPVDLGRNAAGPLGASGVRYLAEIFRSAKGSGRRQSGRACRPSLSSDDAGTIPASARRTDPASRRRHADKRRRDPTPSGSTSMRREARGSLTPSIGGSLFSRVSLNRGYSMTPASETG